MTLLAAFLTESEFWACAFALVVTFGLASRTNNCRALADPVVNVFAFVARFLELLRMWTVLCYVVRIHWEALLGVCYAWCLLNNLPSGKL